MMMRIWPILMIFNNIIIYVPSTVFFTKLASKQSLPSTVFFTKLANIYWQKYDFHNCPNKV